jgi:DNA repair protein RadC
MSDIELLWLAIPIFIIWLIDEIIIHWNSDPLGNRNDYNRPKGMQFKKYYGLTSPQPLSDFEFLMATGMFCEKKEIFVTAFCKQGIVRRVTASIGSHTRCSSSDNPNMWPSHALELGCDEIRQYHNHPNCNGRKHTSNNDIRTHKLFVNLMKNTDISARSFLIYANYYKGWEIKEFGSQGTA